MRYDIKQVIVVRHDLQMRKGKLAAQVAHASIKFIFDKNTSELSSCIDTQLTHDEEIWCNGSFAKIVCRCESEQELLDLIKTARRENVPVYPIIDAGRTEFHGEPTLTCAAFGPMNSKKLDKVTGHLKLM